MKILFLHGLEARPGGVKPTFLAQSGHEVLNPALSDDDFAESVRIAQEWFDKHRPPVVVGSSRGGAVALAIDSAEAGLVLIAPAWKWCVPEARLKTRAIILHSAHDDVVPLSHSQELIAASGSQDDVLRIVGADHRMNDPEAQAALLEAIENV